MKIVTMMQQNISYKIFPIAECNDNDICPICKQPVSNLDPNTNTRSGWFSVVSITCWEKQLEPVHGISITHSNDQYYPFKRSVIPIQKIGNTHLKDW